VQVFKVVVLELLLQRQIVELPSESKLSVDFFLADAEVLHIEETDMLCSVGELFGQLLLAVWGIKEAQVESHQLGPVDLMIKLELYTSDLHIVWTYGLLWSLGLVCTGKGLRLAYLRIVDGSCMV
jgi:hypothetical protein